MSPNSCYNLFWKVYIPASDLNFTKKKKSFTRANSSCDSGQIGIKMKT